jgi:quercetin dioxygenase-like cupin family protein
MATARMPQPTADDPVKVDPKHYKVEFENERVRVLRIKYGAGEKSVMHSHPESIAIFLTDAHGKFTYRTGRRRTSTRKPGRCSTWTRIRTCPKAAARSHSRSLLWS